MIDERTFVKTIVGMLERRVAHRDYYREQTGHIALVAEAQYHDRVARDELDLRLIYNMILGQGIEHGREIGYAEAAEQAATPKKRSPAKKKRRASRT